MMTTKERTEAMRQRAMEVVEVRPFTDEAQRLIDEALEALNLDEEGNRSAAYDFLLKTNGFAGVDVGGELVNKDEAVDVLMKEFGCAKSTAWRHVSRAARQKRHPDYQTPSWGGRRKIGGQRRLTADDVCEIRRLYAAGDHSLADLGGKFGVDPSHVSRIVNRQVWKDVACDE
jgi:hypothetical protein